LNPDASRFFVGCDNGALSRHDKNGRADCVGSVVALLFVYVAVTALRNQHGNSAAHDRSGYTNELGGGIPRTKRIGRSVPT
jgi:hypothetical protein